MLNSTPSTTFGPALMWLRQRKHISTLNRRDRAMRIGTGIEFISRVYRSISASVITGGSGGFFRFAMSRSYHKIRN